MQFCETRTNNLAEEEGERYADDEHQLLRFRKASHTGVDDVCLSLSELDGTVVSRADAGRAKPDLDEDRTNRMRKNFGMVQVKQRNTIGAGHFWHLPVVRCGRTLTRCGQAGGATTCEVFICSVLHA